MEAVEAMEVDPQEADLRVVALQDQVEAVDHQVMDHQEILQLQVQTWGIKLTIPKPC